MMRNKQGGKIAKVLVFFGTAALLYLLETQFTAEATTQRIPLLLIAFFFSLLTGAETYLTQSVQTPQRQTSMLLAAHTLRFVLTIVLFVIYALLVKTALKLFAINLVALFFLSLLISVGSVLKKSDSKNETTHINAE